MCLSRAWERGASTFKSSETNFSLHLFKIKTGLVEVS